MKPNIYKMSRLFSLVIILALIFNSICWARTSDKPIVIRKKIIVSKGEKQKTAIPEPKLDISISKKDTEDEKNIEMDTAVAKNQISLYDSAGKIDPFEPLFKEAPEIKPGSPEDADTDRRERTALEKTDLSQLKLTGIILAASGNKALVREASGRGHVISEGTYIGIHRGRVAGVLKDRVVVKEKMKGPKGRFFFQETELKLNKPGS